MRILLWHGYLLGGTGSNVYTRMLAREWSNAGHDVTVLSQEPHPERFDLGGATAVRPDVGGLLPDLRPRPLRGLRRASRPGLQPAELDAWVEANAAAVRALLPADVVFTNHVLLGGPVGAATGAPFAVKAHGSELEYSMRGNPELSAVGRGGLAGARGDVRRLRPHPRRSCTRSAATPTRARGATRRRHRRVGARATRCCPRRAARGGAPRPAEPRQRGGAAARRGQRRSARALSRAGRARRRLLRQADRAEGRPRPDRGARGARRPARRRRLRRPSAPRSRRSPPTVASRRCSPARSSTATSGTCSRSRMRAWCRRSSPRRSAWSRPRPPPQAVRRSSPGTRASPRSPPGSRRRIRRAPPPGGVRHGRRPRPRPAAGRAARAAGDRPRGHPGCCPHRGGRALELGGRLAPAARAVRAECRRLVSRHALSKVQHRLRLSRSMGDEQRVPTDQLLRDARERFEEATDFTVAVEEEFALLDPARSISSTASRTCRPPRPAPRPSGTWPGS